MAESLSKFYEKEMAKHKVKGLAVAVVDGGKVVWAKGFGLADEARNLPMEPNTVVNLGSGAKLFTSLGAMALAGQGKLGLDAPVSGVLPGLKLVGSGDPGVTARRIMTHHAGFPANYLKGMQSKTLNPAPLALEKLTDIHMAFAPGTVFSHSNLGTAMLGMMVEKAAGEPFSPWMDKAVFAPLGMADTSYTVKPQWEGRMSVSYGHTGAYPPLGSNQPQAVSLFTTAMDQARFLEVLFGADPATLPAGVTPKTLSDMMAPHNTDVSLDMDMRVGLGWNLNRPAFGPAGTVAWNFGRSGGFRSLVMAAPGSKTGVVVLANSSSAEEPRNCMLDRAAEETLRQALAVKGVPAPKPAAPSSCRFLPLDQVAGQYATIIGVVRVTVENNKPVVRLDGKNLDLDPCAEGVYNVKYQMLGITLYDVTKNQSGLKFSFDEAQGKTLLILHQGGERELFGVKVAPYELTPAWEARLGKWVLDNQGDDLPLVKELSLRLEDGLILYESRLPTIMDFKQSLPVLPLGENSGKLAGMGSFSQAMGDEFFFEKTPDGERLHYAGYLFRKKQG
jgi:CubicO group peptidase (beta-lactamase class C family)